MNRAAVEAFLHKHSRIGLDTSIFIFQIEENPDYIHLTDPIFAWLDGPRGNAVASTITMLEVLVQPYRLLNQRVHNFYILPATYPHLEWIAPTLDIAALAARLRARYNFRTPDAIQAATAVSAQATGFVSNDYSLKRMADLDVLVLADLN